MHHIPSIRSEHAVPDGLPDAFFGPAQTVRCVGLARFRTQAVRDAGCLLDVDPEVVSWTCGPRSLTDGPSVFLPDFEVVRRTAVELVAVVEGPDGVPDWACVAAEAKGMPLLAIDAPELVGVRLENARDILRYARWRVSLSDRVRLLAALDEEGSLTLAEAMTAVRATADPIAAIAALALHRFVTLDLDSGRIGPETRIARWRD